MDRWRPTRTARAAAARPARTPAARSLAAARAEFAGSGYDGTTLRGIARAAGVDPRLVHHYFDGKDDLSRSRWSSRRVNPAVMVDRVLQGPLDTLGERLVRTFLAVWDDPDNQERLVALVRAVIPTTRSPR